MDQRLRESTTAGTSAVAVVPGKEARDIEQVLAWAYRDKLVGGSCTLYEAPSVHDDEEDMPELRMSRGASEEDGDAAEIQRAVHGLRGMGGRFGTIARLIEQHARTGSRPDWKPRGTQVLPVLRADGKPKIEHVDAGRKVPFCPLIWRHGPDSLALYQHQWALWHVGLVSLARALEGRLQRFTVTGPKALAEPWTDGAEIWRALIRGV